VDVREETRSMHTEVDVPDPSRILVPGRYAEATIALERRDDAIAVPLEAVDQSYGKTTVDMVDVFSKVAIRPFDAGIQTATYVEVLSGLREGEMVMVSDRSGLKAGQPVQFKLTDLMQYQSSEGQH
jgi:multidrug efflux pump subunit AcrA (membrane-fusion protein)